MDHISARGSMARYGRRFFAPMRPHVRSSTNGSKACRRRKACDRLHASLRCYHFGSRNRHPQGAFCRGRGPRLRHPSRNPTCFLLLGPPGTGAVLPSYLRQLTRNVSHAQPEETWMRPRVLMMDRRPRPDRCPLPWWRRTAGRSVEQSVHPRPWSGHRDAEDLVAVIASLPGQLHGTEPPPGMARHNCAKDSGHLRPVVPGAMRKSLSEDRTGNTRCSTGGQNWLISHNLHVFMHRRSGVPPLAKVKQSRVRAWLGRARWARRARARFVRVSQTHLRQADIAIKPVSVV